MLYTTPQNDVSQAHILKYRIYGFTLINIVMERILVDSKNLTNNSPYLGNGAR